MPKYQVLVDVRNLLVDIDGVVAKRGFLIYSVIEADDATAAEDAAIDTVRGDGEISEMILNQDDDPPVISIEETLEVDAFFNADSQSGRVWYEMYPKRWWQFWRR